ncbi:cell division protein FtsA [Patescibacteria group bacterium]
MAKQKIIAGVDIGSSKITTVIASLSEEEEGKVGIIGVSSIVSKGVRKGQIVDIEEAAEVVIESIEAAERMAGYNITRTLVSVGGPHISSRNTKGVVAVAEPEKEISDEDVRRVIEAARAISLPSTREIIHVLPRFFTVDGQEGIKDPVGMSGVRLEVETHIATGSVTAMKNLVKCVSEVGADVQSLVFSGLASSESSLTATEKELGVVLVDIGGGVTDISIFVEGSPFYAATLPIGARNVTNDIAIGLRLSLESAEKIKLALSKRDKKVVLPRGKEGALKKKKTKFSDRDADEISLRSLGVTDEKKKISKKTLTEGIIKPRLIEVFNMVGEEIKKSGAAGLIPSGIVVSGGGALTVGLEKAAKQCLSMPVRVGSPQGITGLIDDVQTPEYATAIGLVLYGARHQVEPAVSFSLGQIGRSFNKIPLKGVFGRAIGLVKSFLP